MTAAFDGDSAIEQFCAERCDLVILDVMLPGRNGMEVLREVRALGNTPVIMLTALADEYTQLKSFDLLADEYVTKPFSPIVLVRRVEALLRRSRPIDRTVVSFEDIVADFSSYTVSKGGQPVMLTTKEIEILRALIEHRGQALSRAQILDAVWSLDSDISDRIVDTHIKNLRRKLDCRSIQTVKGVGYRFEVVE